MAMEVFISKRKSSFSINVTLLTRNTRSLILCSACEYYQQGRIQVFVYFLVKEVEQTRVVNGVTI